MTEYVKYTVSQKSNTPNSDITLSVLNLIQNSFAAQKRTKFFQQKLCNTSHYTTVCCHTTLQKLKLQILANVEENANKNVTCIDF